MAYATPTALDTNASLCKHQTIKVAGVQDEFFRQDIQPQQRLDELASWLCKVCRGLVSDKDMVIDEGTRWPVTVYWAWALVVWIFDKNPHRVVRERLTSQLQDMNPVDAFRRITILENLNKTLRRPNRRVTAAAGALLSHIHQHDVPRSMIPPIVPDKWLQEVLTTHIVECDPTGLTVTQAATDMMTRVSGEMASDIDDVVRL